MRKLPGLLCVAVAAAVACSDAFSPTIENVAGDYHLQRLATWTDTSGTKDWKAAGSTITISLNPNGTTTGALFIPGGNDDGGDLVADMAGTWTLVRSTVEFDQPNADTFVRDYQFTAGKNRLSSVKTIPGAKIEVVLMK